MSNLIQEILDAIPAHIALLDPDGQIEFVNEAWRNFGAANGLTAETFAIGLNYLDVCDNTYGESADNAAEISFGIRAVLRGEVSSFELKKYSCHSLDKKLWFRAVVTPIVIEERCCALVTHINITERGLAEQTLRENEQQYRALAIELDRERKRLVTAQAVAKVGSWETDLSTMKVFWSAETYRIFEVSQNSFVPTHSAFLDLVHPDDRAAVDIAFRDSISQKGTRSIDHRLLLPGNRVKYITETWQIIVDDSGKPLRAVGTCQDISERQAIHTKLSESEARLERAQEIAGLGSWEIDVQQGSIILSKQMYHIRGLVPDGKPLLLRDIQQVVSEDHEKVTAWLKRLEAGEEVEALEVSIRRPDGDIRIVSNEAKSIFDQNGRVAKISGTQRDVTEARRSEQELRQSQLHLALAQRVASMGSAAIDFRTGKWDWSDETFRIYGVNRGQFTPSFAGLGTLLHPDDRDELLSKPALALTGVTPPPIEYRIKRPDGVERTLRREATLVRDDGGQVIGIVGTVQDVTELRAAEREKNLLQAQLRQGQRLEAIGQMTGGIAHDFNNLLTVILGNAEVFERHLSKNKPLRELAEMTRLAAERGAALTGQLLAFSRQQPLDPKPIDVNALVSGMYTLLRRALGEHFRINTVCSPGLWRALIDAAQLESAILNLSVNARDAMPDGGCLTIETKNVELDETYIVDQLQPASEHSEIVPGQYVMIAVSDTGTGMNEATRLKAFDPFFTTKDVGKGSGLGLSMVYGFVRQSKGHIRIYSELGHGTTIKLYLARANETTVASDARLGEPSVPGGSERILVVEDDDLVRNQVTSQLTGLGYQVVTAEDGVETLDLLRTSKEFDLLFTDLVMPRGINGRELADQALRLQPDLRVLFTSGYAENAIVHHGRLDPGVHLLNKPYRRSELAAKIRYVLDER